MRRLSAIFPYPRRLVGWFPIPGIPGTEILPEPEPGEPGEPGELCDIEILSIEPLYQPTSLAIESVDIILLDDNDGVRYQATINVNYPDGLQYRVLKAGEEYHGWQESNVFEFPFSERDNEFEFVAINFWEETRHKVKMLPTSYEAEVEFTGEPKRVMVHFDGEYEVELWGAQGGGNPDVVDHGAKGGYAKGKIHLNVGDELYVYTGGKGVYGGDMDGETSPGGWNGGGDGGAGITGISGSSGGGATDIRLNGTDLENRIAVAAGAAGGNGTGTLNVRRDGSSGGGGGYYGGGGGGNYLGNNVIGQGGTQEEGGSGWTNGHGQLGIGGDGEERKSTSTYGTSQLSPGGDGGGLTGGDGFYSARGSTGGGGSSFIDMLEDGETTAGIREGDGLAKITFLGFATASYYGHNVTLDENEDYLFDIQYSGFHAEIRILHGETVLHDWSTDTQFVIDKSLEDQQITIEVRDILDNIVTETATVMIVVYEEFEATSAGHDGTIQEYETPATGIYNITAYGAEGGWISGNDAPAGKGAMMKGKVMLEEGDTLLIVVGQKGGENSSDGGQAGGGGTFVVKVVEHSDYLMFDGRYVVPILVAGGGSGAPNTSSYNLLDGQITTRGYEYQSVGNTNNSGAGGGGGFTQAGGGNSAHWGQSFLSGAKGGAISGWASGGFGCGGGKGSSYNDGAGGGGFDGGDHTYANIQGGGGSFNSGTEQDNVAGVREGHGKVIIELFAIA